VDELRGELFTPARKSRRWVEDQRRLLTHYYSRVDVSPR